MYNNNRVPMRAIIYKYRTMRLTQCLKLLPKMDELIFFILRNMAYQKNINIQPAQSDSQILMVFMLHAYGRVLNIVVPSNLYIILFLHLIIVCLVQGVTKICKHRVYISLTTCKAIYLLWLNMIFVITYGIILACFVKALCAMTVFVMLCLPFNITVLNDENMLISTTHIQCFAD